MAWSNLGRDIHQLFAECEAHGWPYWWLQTGFRIDGKPYCARSGRGSGRRGRLKPNDRRTFQYFAANEARRQARDAQRQRELWDEEAGRIARDVLAVDLARMVRAARNSP